MARYKVLATSFIEGRIVEEGEEVEFDHDPGHNLEPIDGAGRKRKADFDKAGGGKRAAPGDPGFISQMMDRNNETAAGKTGQIPGPGASAKNDVRIFASDSSAPTE